MIRQYGLHAGLFFLTLVSTLFAGAYYIQDYDLLREFPRYVLPGLVKGAPFSLPLMLILASHELAHYRNSMRHHVDASLPYFIPFPLNLFGTLGAVIKMKSPIRDRDALIDIGASGPLVGFAFSVVVCVVGLSLSDATAVRPIGHEEAALGGSILYLLMAKAIIGADLSHQAVNLHPIAVAGWVGLFVTSINLMPVGQLDGGHISYAFLGRYHRTVSRVFIFVLAVMGYWFTGWLMWAALLIFIGTRHPPVIDPERPLDLKRKLAGAGSLVVFIITFTPMPVYINL